MAVQHHLDQPLMQINEIDISPGFETQVGPLTIQRNPDDLLSFILRVRLSFFFLQNYRTTLEIKQFLT